MWEDIAKPAGIDNTPGTKINFLFADHAQIVAPWPELPAAPAATADYNTIVTDFTFSDPLTEGFVSIYVTPKRGKVDNESVGADDCKNFSHKYEFWHPGNSDVIEAFIRQVKNKHFSCVVTEKDGTQRLVGTKDCPARIEAITGGTGGGPEDEKGQLFQIISEGNVGFAPKFTGAAPLKP